MVLNQLWIWNYKSTKNIRRSSKYTYAYGLNIFLMLDSSPPFMAKIILSLTILSYKNFLRRVYLISSLHMKKKKKNIHEILNSIVASI